ncbi:MAG: S1/P1 nuclease [Acidobacteria bacterium]|nr:S1/P1 nuclease [Acidobacteriota bacterium]
MRNLFLSMVLLAALPGNGFGWGREGHRLVARIAALHLNGKAQAEAAKLLAGESLESIAAWADEVRPQRKETTTWHYINIPIKAERGDWRQYCPASGCVLRSVQEMAAKLKNPALPAGERTEALKFLVHFAGDMHQPLHVSDNGDRGGNDVPIIFQNRPSNLHSVWDTPIVLQAEAQPGFEARVTKKAGYWERKKLQKGSVGDWAWDSVRISRSVTYGLLPAGRPAKVEQAYVKSSVAPVEAQIRRAGLRLALLLNQSLGR